jgi:hypothetical protein
LRTASSRLSLSCRDAWGHKMRQGGNMPLRQAEGHKLLRPAQPDEKQQGIVPPKEGVKILLGAGRWAERDMWRARGVRPGLGGAGHKGTRREGQAPAAGRLHHQAAGTAPRFAPSGS